MLKQPLESGIKNYVPLFLFLVLNKVWILILLVRNKNNSTVILLVYVDDIILTINYKEELDKAKVFLKS